MVWHEHHPVSKLLQPATKKLAADMLVVLLGNDGRDSELEDNELLTSLHSDEESHPNPIIILPP